MVYRALSEKLEIIIDNIAIGYNDRSLNSNKS